jgi:hypothetical protein
MSAASLDVFTYNLLVKLQINVDKFIERSPMGEVCVKVFSAT